MCIGLPMRLIEKEGIRGKARLGAAVQDVDLSLTPQAAPGDHLLVFLGAAREVLSPARAQAIAAAHDALRAVLSGGDTDSGFTDLVGREPPLPPHLQAALAAGRTLA